MQAESAAGQREAARVKAEMESLSSLWDGLKDGAERVENMEGYLINFSYVLRLQAWARGAHARRRLQRSRGT